MELNKRFEGFFNLLKSLGFEIVEQCGGFTITDNGIRLASVSTLPHLGKKVYYYVMDYYIIYSYSKLSDDDMRQHWNEFFKDSYGKYILFHKIGNKKVHLYCDNGTNLELANLVFNAEKVSRLFLCLRKQMKKILLEIEKAEIENERQDDT